MNNQIKQALASLQKVAIQARRDSKDSCFNLTFRVSQSDYAESLQDYINEIAELSGFKPCYKCEAFTDKAELDSDDYCESCARDFHSCEESRTEAYSSIRG